MAAQDADVQEVLKTQSLRGGTWRQVVGLDPSSDAVYHLIARCLKTPEASWTRRNIKEMLEERSSLVNLLPDAAGGIRFMNYSHPTECGCVLHCIKEGAFTKTEFIRHRVKGEGEHHFKLNPLYLALQAYLSKTPIYSLPVPVAAPPRRDYSITAPSEQDEGQEEKKQSRERTRRTERTERTKRRAKRNAPSSSKRQRTAQDDEQPRIECITCRAAPPEMLFFPCLHLVTCKTCTDKLLRRDCPKCRQHITSDLKVSVM